MDQNEDCGPANLGNPVESTMLELAQKVLQAIGSTSPVKHLDLPKDDPRQRCPNIGKAKRLLNWEPQVPLNVGLERTIKYYRELMEEG
jgi:UDP-glucuronate decarboxylase